MTTRIAHNLTQEEFSDKMRKQRKCLEFFRVDLYREEGPCQIKDEYLFRKWEQRGLSDKFSEEFRRNQTLSAKELYEIITSSN